MAIRIKAAAGVVALALPATGCGGGSARLHVAQLGATAHTRSEKVPALAAFYSCMAARGFASYRMPSPGPKGRIVLSPAEVAIVNTTRFEAAQKACGPLVPRTPPTPAQTAAARAEGLKYARCARTHGLPAFPDPNSQGEADVKAAGIDTNSSAFLRVVQACRRFLTGYFVLVE